MVADGLFSQTPTATWEATAPLLYLSATHLVGRQVGRYLTIQPLTTDEKASFIENPFVSDLMGYFAVDGAELKLAGAYSHPHGDASGVRQEISRDVGCFITALRLLKSGDVGVPAMFHLYRGGNATTFSLEPGEMLSIVAASPRAQHMTTTELEEYHVVSQGNPYLLAQSDVAALQNLVDCLLSVDVQDALGMGLRRFNQAYSRRVLEDRVMDLTIALECTLLHGLGDEFSYRLSLRGAALLVDALEAPFVQSRLQTLYDARSKIVHEGLKLGQIKKIKALDLRPHQFVEECHQITRSVLRNLASQVAARQRASSLAPMQKAVSGSSPEDRPLTAILKGLDFQIIEGIGQNSTSDG